jgi:hypothetical protein
MCYNCCIFKHISKVFDTVSLLISKLSNIGLSDPVVACQSNHIYQVFCKTSFNGVLCTGVFYRSPGVCWSMVSHSRCFLVAPAGKSEWQRMWQFTNFVELALVTNNGDIELVESTYNLKSCPLCQTISPFSVTANGQIAIYLSITRKVVNRKRHRLIRCTRQFILETKLSRIISAMIRW